MKRIHAFEWEDQQWFPVSWRDYGTDYLRFIATKFDIYKAIVPVIKKGIESTGRQEWVDCASGGGGALPVLAEHLKNDFPNLKIIMTDYYPNIATFEKIKSESKGVIQYEKTSVDATNVPKHLEGNFRTMFGSFHHFRPEDAQQILQNAIDTQTPIAIFEPLGRNIPSFISMLFVPINVLVLTLFIRPLRWNVLPFIYILPLIPLYVWWDGIVSVFRMYSVKEMNEMISKLKNTDSFEWEVGYKEAKPSSVFYAIGIPKKKN